MKSPQSSTRRSPSRRSAASPPRRRDSREAPGSRRTPSSPWAAEASSTPRSSSRRRSSTGARRSFSPATGRWAPARCRSSASPRPPERGPRATPVAIFTDPETGNKLGVVDPCLVPDLVLLDPALTDGLPPLPTAAAGMDALVHALEAFTAKIATPIARGLALEAARRLGPALPAVCKDGGDKPARDAMLIGANLAGLAFANSSCCGVLALALPLGGRFHIVHGVATGCLVAETLRHNLPACRGTSRCSLAPSAGRKATPTACPGSWPRSRGPSGSGRSLPPPRSPSRPLPRWRRRPSPTAASWTRTPGPFQMSMRWRSTAGPSTTMPDAPTPSSPACGSAPASGPAASGTRTRRSGSSSATPRPGPRSRGVALAGKAGVRRGHRRGRAGVRVLAQ